MTVAGSTLPGTIGTACPSPWVHVLQSYGTGLHSPTPWHMRHEGPMLFLLPMQQVINGAQQPSIPEIPVIWCVPWPPGCQGPCDWALNRGERR